MAIQISIGVGWFLVYFSGQFSILPIHTNRYLNYHSAHSNEQKQGVVINLYNRAQLLITKSTDWKKEKSFLYILELANNSEKLANRYENDYFVHKTKKKSCIK